MFKKLLLILPITFFCFSSEHKSSPKSVKQKAGYIGFKVINLTNMQEETMSESSNALQNLKISKEKHPIVQKIEDIRSEDDIDAIVSQIGKIEEIDKELSNEMLKAAIIGQHHLLVEVLISGQQIVPTEEHLEFALKNQFNQPTKNNLDIIRIIFQYIPMTGETLIQVTKTKDRDIIKTFILRCFMNNTHKELITENMKIHLNQKYNSLYLECIAEFKEKNPHRVRQQ